MARQMKKVSDLPGQSDSTTRRRAQRSRRSERAARFREVTFETLTAKQKDRLLKELAVQAGLIDDSDDE